MNRLVCPPVILISLPVIGVPQHRLPGAPQPGVVLVCLVPHLLVFLVGGVAHHLHAARRDEHPLVLLGVPPLRRGVFLFADGELRALHAVHGLHAPLGISLRVGDGGHARALQFGAQLRVHGVRHHRRQDFVQRHRPLGLRLEVSRGHVGRLVEEVNDLLGQLPADGVVLLAEGPLHRRRCMASSGRVDQDAADDVRLFPAVAAVCLIGTPHRLDDLVDAVVHVLQQRVILLLGQVLQASLVRVDFLHVPVLRRGDSLQALGRRAPQALAPGLLGGAHGLH